MTIGKTKDAGWQVGVSRTVPYPLEDVWELLLEPDGICIWLGDDINLKDAAKGDPYETGEGTVGEIRSLLDHDRIRLTWQPEDWDHESTVQIAVAAKGPRRTTVQFHQERLISSAERERQRDHWKRIASALVDELESRPKPGNH